MSVLQRIDQISENDENLLVLKRPDDVTSSGIVKLLATALVASFGPAGIIISTATLVSALLR